MKTVLYVTIMLAIVSSVGYGQANTTLSNLTSPTAINQDLLPNSTNTHNLGAASRGWGILYIDSSVYLKDSLFMHNSGTYNTFVGQRAGFSIATGFDNAAFGFHALYNNKVNSFNSAFGSFALANATGSYNTAVGYRALFNNTTGSRNSAIGVRSLFNNKTGHYNIAMGDSVLFSNTSGSNNIANGSHALFSNTIGYSNVAIGASALYSNTHIGNQVAVGDSALYNNYDGFLNTAIGSKSLYANTTGTLNTANGAVALYSNTTGNANTANGYQALYSNTVGNKNTANGIRALYSNTTGNTNTANGVYALYSNTTGIENTANGEGALYLNTTGIFNTADGLGALYSNTTGGYNTALGDEADVRAGNLQNATVIGHFGVVDASNKVRVGNPYVTSIGGQVGWSNFSDGRYKKNIKQDVQGLAFIKSLLPITYTVDITGLDEYFDKGRKHDRSYEKVKADMKESADKASKIIYNGFIAQDVEKAAAKLNYNFSGVDKPQSKDGLYGLRYADFVVPLVKAVQELDKKTEEIDELKTQVQQQNQKITELTQLVQSLIQTKKVNSSNSYLSQNIPNPTNGNTVIPFQIAAGSRTAVIQIIETGSGQILKTISVDVNAKQATLNIASFAAGSYVYSLIVDGKTADSKQMILTK